MHAKVYSLDLSLSQVILLEKEENEKEKIMQMPSENLNIDLLRNSIFWCYYPAFGITNRK
jgi:hypothetical protein